MRTYLLAGRPIASSVAISQLEVTERCSLPPYLTVLRPAEGRRPAPVRRWHHAWQDDDGRTVIGLRRQDAGYLLRISRRCDFMISRDGALIAARPFRAMSAATLEHLLANQVLPRCLAQRGEFVAHGACVEMGGRLAVFVGETGRGKSTLAGLLLRRGHTVLTDDCVVLRPAASGVRAVATYPGLRLNSDSARALFPETASEAGDAYSHKHRVALPARPRATAGSRVAAIYYLGRSKRKSVRIARMLPASTCIRMMEQSFQLDVLDRKAVGRLLRKAAAVAAEVPGFVLEYPRRYGQADALARVIESHLAGLPARRRQSQPRGRQ